MPDFLAQLAENIEKFLTWKFLTLCFFVSLIVLLAIQIPLVCNILETMYTTIRIFLVVICLFSFAGILYKSLACCFIYVQKNFEQLNLERKTALEREKRQSHYIQQLKQLSEAENKFMQLALKNSYSGICLPKNNAAVHTLLYKGLLKRISDLEVFEDWDNSGEREVCILVIIPEELQQIL